ELLGLTFSKADATSIRNAGKSFAIIEQSVKGVGIQLATGLAPIIEAGAKKFEELVISAGGFGKLVPQVLEVAVDVFADFVDVLDATGKRFDAIKERAVGFVSFIRDSADIFTFGLASGFGSLKAVAEASKTGDGPSSGDKLRALFNKNKLANLNA